MRGEAKWFVHSANKLRPHEHCSYKYCSPATEAILKEFPVHINMPRSQFFFEVRERVRAASAYSPNGRTILPRLAYTFTSERTPRLGLPHTLPRTDVNAP
ncbi:hypothetical protein V9T40_014551 [Parthenolecanium corni]|uniref:Uncharacterized protein n=1 Tax=Parthenolecanium corni TaxID=536013 RepID=A0AAN9T3F3_9HEMI